jgi:hypothetical protein
MAGALLRLFSSGGYHVCAYVSGWVYTEFVMNLFAHRVLGWRIADDLHSDLGASMLPFGTLSAWRKKRSSHSEAEAIAPATAPQRNR